MEKERGEGGKESQGGDHTLLKSYLKGGLAFGKMFLKMK